MPIDVSSVHSANSTYTNAMNNGPSGPALPPKEQPNITPQDRVVLADLTNLQKDKTPADLDRDGQKLLKDLITQENPKGQEGFARAVLGGKIKTPAQIAALNKMLKANANAPLGDVTLMADDALAQAASSADAHAAAGPSLKGMNESPASAVVSSAYSSQQPPPGVANNAAAMQSQAAPAA